MRGSTAGISDDLALAGPRLLAALDPLLGSVLVAPAVVSYWRGTWCLMDGCLDCWGASLAIGLAGHMLFTLLQRPLEARLRPHANFLYYAGSRIYTAVFGFCCVNSWRGAWKLLDAYTGLELREVAATTALGVVVLAAMRTLRNISAPPFAIITDVPEGYFEVPTLFRISSRRSMALYVLDCLFSVLVVGTLVVFVWRGAWTLLDLYLFTSEPSWSACASLMRSIISGVAVAIAAMILSLKCCREARSEGHRLRHRAGDVQHPDAAEEAVRPHQGLLEDRRGGHLPLLLLLRHRQPLERLLEPPQHLLPARQTDGELLDQPRGAAAVADAAQLLQLHPGAGRVHRRRGGGWQVRGVPSLLPAALLPDETPAEAAEDPAGAAAPEGGAGGGQEGQRLRRGADGRQPPGPGAAHGRPRVRRLTAEPPE